MSKKNVQPRIKIVKVTNDKEIATLPSGLFGAIDKKFQEIHQVISGINLVVVLSLIAIIISIIGIFLDQMRINNVFYKEYSEKIGTLEIIQNSNKELIEENKRNNILIIEQQKQLIELLNKK